MITAVRFILPASLALLLTACQHHSSSQSQRAVSMDQIATVVAASKWVKTHCDRSDIPDLDTLMRNALALGKIEKGQADSQALMQAVNGRYDAIDSDRQTRSQKCVALNASLAPFLQKN
ncbi:type II secretion system pilot lipoprotein GspS [Enterobacter mori]